MSADPGGAADRFFTLLEAALRDGTLVKLLLTKYHGAEPELQRISVRPVTLRGADCLSFVHRHRTRDITKNLPITEAVALLRTLPGPAAFRQAHLTTREHAVELAFSQRGQSRLSVHAVPATGEAAKAPPPAAHDRVKQRALTLDRPFLQALGVTDAQRRLVPSMARKWKQINKFIEVFDAALKDSRLAGRPVGATPLRIADFGSGKGYLTFALHDHLRHGLGLPVQVTGVELRPDMVQLCNDAIARLGLDGLAFEEGDVRSRPPQTLDVMIALHACDIATDHAIHTGIRAGAAIILCSPCCHKQLRPQLLTPHPLRPLLQHGIHLGQEAEMLTDGLRALLLEAAGYATQVFEFVALEHTSKNKMILAVKRERPAPPGEVLQQVRELKAFYGIREQALETLLQADGLIAA